MAWAPVAQAAATVAMGPLAPKYTLTWWLGMLGMEATRAKGLTRDSPWVRKIWIWRSATS
jgi:hypothetical protein